MKAYRKALVLGVVWVIGSFMPVYPQAAARPDLSKQSSAKVQPPPVPAVPERAPVARFRELLAMTHQDRQKALEQRPEVARKLIEQKLHEYDELSPEECELRLRLTELRYYLLPLMSMAPTNRTAQLQVVPEELRSMIDLRLRNWDQLPAEKQRELIESEQVVRYLAGSSMSLAAGQTARAGASTPAIDRQALQTSIGKWEKLSVSERVVIANRVEEYFDLSPREKAETLSRVSPQERIQIEKTLQTLNRLEPSDRAQCIRALNRLSGFSVAEQQTFLKNAERWRALSPEERKAWRGLVANLSHQPPLPPGLARPPLPRIPNPPVPAAPAGAQKVATND